MQEHVHKQGEHEIHYVVHGIQGALPVFFLHGGPGLGSKEVDLDFFDLQKYQVFLIDQRACGKSQPKGLLEYNTTTFLLDDLKAIVDKHSLDSVILFGGSWGATLALLFSLKYPELVKALILRGIFLGTKAERALFEKGGPNSNDHAWSHIRKVLPMPEDDLNFLFKSILSSEGEKQQEQSKALMRYNYSFASALTEGEIENILESSDYLSHALLLSHYSINDFFIEDNYILDRINIIANKKVQIVHGLQDRICRPAVAVELSRQLNNCTLHLVEGGHASSEPLIKKKLIEIMNNIADENQL